MKKNLLIMLVAVLGIVACGDVEKAPDGFTSNSIAQIPQSITVHRGRLVFATMQDYAQVLTELTNQKEAWDESLNQIYGNLSDDSASLLINLNDIRFEQPLLDFTTSYPTFSSLLQDIEGKADTWLETELLEFATDPYNHFVMDPVDQATLNINSEVIIAGNGYKYVEDGLIRVNSVTFLDSNLNIDDVCDVLDDIELGLITYSDENEEKRTLGIFDFLGNGDKNLPCAARAIERDAGDETFGGHRIHWYIEINSPISGGCECQALTRNFRKKNNGGWIRYYTNTKVQTYGKTVNPTNCTKYDFSSITKERKAFDLKVDQSTTTCKAQSGDVHGYHFGAAGNSYVSTLTF